MVEHSVSRGEYADGRTYALPPSWRPLETVVRDVAVERTLAALGPTKTPGRSPIERQRSYYDPNGNYAGALMSTIEPNPVDELTAADLFAVTTLSMTIPALAARRLLDPRDERRRTIQRRLSEIPYGLPITSLDSEDTQVVTAKKAMWELHNEIRTLMAPETSNSNRWVFAAKLCARKRPWLFPVRDNRVCEYLAANRNLRRGAGMSQFDNDLQLFGYLMSNNAITDELARLRRTLEGEGLRLDDTDLRLLDVVVWTAAQPS